MKRTSILLLGFAIAAFIAVGYSDSHVIKEDSFQVAYENAYDAIPQVAVDITAELPLGIEVVHPRLGAPTFRCAWVSEKLTGVLKRYARPPPVKVQKSDYNIC